MADTITATSNLSVEVKFYEVSDTTLNTDTTATATIKIPNPASGLTENEIKSQVSTFLKPTGASEPIYKYYDSKGAEYALDSSTDISKNITTAYTVNQTINNIDIGWED